MALFDKLLIANRGEIACRIIKSAQRLKIKTVAVYSDADAHARHVRMADEAVCIGPAPARDSYLVIEKIIAAALKTGAQAIHPGYGFLSENDQFCEACQQAGLVFVGPPVAAIRAMGSKSAAKTLMEKAGLPLTPGYHGDSQDADFLQSQAETIGYPVLIKAAAGGGGKGMRLVENAADFMAALAGCQREAAASFGNDQMLVEKYITQPRHIEIQVFGDSHGNYVHLFERDCSVQRRHQKVLEEAPAPGMTALRRAAMGQAAVEAARAVGYVGAGTVEFIADQDGGFYFMEMNTRLQVEHPVTEMITGVDLVEWQLRVAAGEPLPLAQEQLVINGHALEARIYAEDPDKGFLPSTGRLVHLATPGESHHVRVDSGVEAGDEITPYYDPMIAKLIVWDADRDQALARMEQALAEYRIVGVANNVEFLARLVACPAFAGADLDTGLIEREKSYLFPEQAEPSAEVWLLLVLAELLREHQRAESAACNHQDATSPWHIADGWRMNAEGQRSLEFEFEGHRHLITATVQDSLFEIALAGVTHQVSGALSDNSELHARIDSVHLTATVVASQGQRHLFFQGRCWRFSHIDPLQVDLSSVRDGGGLLAPMPGRIIALLVDEGAEVHKGDPLLVMEAMKMEHTLVAPADGTVVSYPFAEDQQIQEGAELVVFNPTEDAR